MPLSDANNWEKHFPNLPAYQKYKELNEVDITGYNNDKCDKLAKSDDGDKKLCKQILKNLSVLKTKKGEEQERGCYYFQNWLHDQIKGKYYNEKDQGSKYSIANELFNLVADDISSNGINQACRGNSFGTPETWKKEKDLYDYFENFEKIKCKDSDRDECQKYVNYVTYIDPIYNTKINDCCDDGELEPYCDPSIRCESKYDTKKLVAELKKQLQAIDKKKADADAAEQEEAKAKQAEAEKAKQLEEDRKKAQAERDAQERAKREKAKQEKEAQEEENRKKAAAAAQRLKDEAAAAEAKEKELAAVRGGQQTVRGETGALQPEPSLGVPPRDSHEDSVNAATTYNSGISGDAGHASLAGVPSTLESVSDMVDSNFIRNIIMAVAVLGTIFFLFYYNREDKLKDLPLYRVYENLDRGLAHGEDWGDCSQLGSFNSEATTLCKKMARNLRELAGTHKINNRRDKCYYLQHWLYYKTRLLTSNMSSSNKYMIISRLREIAKRINAKVLDKIRCECYFIHENYWKVDKDLHDYFKNFDHIKCDSSDKEKCKKFIDYVTYINKLYKADKDYCCYGGLVDEDSCLPYFKCDPSYDPNDLLKNLKSAIGESHRIQVAKGGPAVDERASSRRYQNSYMSRGRNEEEHVAYINTHDHAHEGTDGFSHMIGTMGNMLRSNIVYRSIAAVTIVGILIFCFYYVKANPFGSKSNKRKRGKDEFLDSEEDAYEEEFPPNELDHSFGDSQMGSLHMNYYPSHDSYY